MADELLAADRAFAGAAAHTDAPSALAAMFSGEIVMPVPGSGFARGTADVVAALRAIPGFAQSRLEWTPVRAGISADGAHGFTYGFMIVRRPDGTTQPFKYLSYWIREPAGWRVAVYKRGRRAEGPMSLEVRPLSVPPRMVPVSTDAAAIAGFRESLDLAERTFSNDAQRIGLGPAFARHGSADAVNMGGPTSPDFLLGAEFIGRIIGTVNPGSPVSWAPDQVIVASSGDLGVTIGFIHPNAPGPDGARQAGIPFFTIWRRDSPSHPWRYVAE